MSAAPTVADEGQRGSADEERHGDAAHAPPGDRASSRPEQRGGERERQAGRQPVREALHQHDELQRRLAHQEEVERAVLVVGLEEPVEAEQRGQRGGDPEDGRADARQQVEVRPDGEGHDRDEHQEEDEAHQRRRRRCGRRAAVRGREGRGARAHGCPPRRGSVASGEAERHVGGGDDDAAAARCSATRAAKRSCEAASSAEVGSSSSQSGRRETSSRAKRQAAALPGRQIGAGEVGGVVEPHPSSASAGVSGRAEHGLPEGEALERRQGRLQRVAVADIVGDARASVRSRASPSSAIRPAGRLQQPGQHQQQARLAGAVAPGEDQGLAAVRAGSDSRRRRRGRSAGRQDPRRRGACNAETMLRTTTFVRVAASLEIIYKRLGCAERFIQRGDPGTPGAARVPTHPGRTATANPERILP